MNRYARRTALLIGLLAAPACKSSHAETRGTESNSAKALVTASSAAAATASSPPSTAATASAVPADSASNDPLVTDLDGAKSGDTSASRHWVTNRTAQIKFASPPGYKESKRGEWVAYGSPDGSAVIAMTTFDRPNESTRKLGTVAQALGVSNIDWKQPKSMRLGDGDFVSHVAAGSCDAGGRASIAYATINPGGSTQVLFVYFVKNSAPKERMVEVKEFLKSLRRP